ncbi:hypothetical protein PybrP1_007865 [[Pythium] brassicae (nom. inval.)]|nr:hypothetical protein PybrP1_007865 [[Pythium] brassicae (nom. inval.)]
MDPAMTRLRALLAAAAASARPDAPPPLSAASAAVAAFSAEDRAFWDAADAQTTASAGLLLASASVADARLVRVLRALLEAPLFCSSAGVLRVAREGVRGLKLARRWHALALASDELPDAAHARVRDLDLDAGVAPLALELWLELLLGCQHSAELFQRSHAKLADTAALLAEQRQRHGGDKCADELEAMIRHFVLACAALMHCHRGYEHDAYLLQLALKQAFTEADLSRPTAAGVEALLREAAWVQPIEQMGEFVLPSVEGKWVADDFAGDQHASGASAPQNAGSVLLRRTSQSFAHAVSASVQHRDGSQKLRLSGVVFQQMPEMQALLAQPERALATPWELEGHWSQVYEAAAPAAARPSAPLVSSASTPWTCQACTMANDASAAKCATCGTESPSRVAVQTPFDDVQGSNPAPFTAAFDASHSFMRLQWSRGEQYGAWLARKQRVARQFDLGAGVAALGDRMSDSASVPVHAYSPSGRAANVLLLEKPVVSSGAHPELTVQVWVRAPAPCMADDGDPLHVVLGFGSEFQLSLSRSGELAWEIAGGAHRVQFPQPLAFDAFHHVTLSLGSRTVEMAVDGLSTGEHKFSDDVRKSLFAQRSPVFTIGGSLGVAEAGASVTNVFSGVICDLRIWSTVQPSVPVSVGLSGAEENLLGYYPLVGNAQRVLLDLSTAENHATVFEAYRPRDVLGVGKAAVVVTNNFAPTVELASLPVMLHLASALGSDFVGSGAFAVVDGSDALRIERGPAGAALWQLNPVSVLSGFQTSFQLERATQSGSSDAFAGNVVFALSEASYWNMTPLIAEAGTLFGSSPSGVARSDRSALFVSVAPREGGAIGGVQYTIGLFVRSKNHNYKLAQARQVVSSASTLSIHVAYRVPEQLLSVALAADEDPVFECAVDIPRALGLQSASALRVGLVFPASASHEADVRLDSWRYEELAGAVDASASSLLASVYSEVAAFQPAQANSDAFASKPANAVLCTRSSTDGSAIEQESYGCQTCSLVHGSAVCRVCASVCHEGHELVAMGVMSSACACQVRGTGLCRCSSGVNADDFPQLQHPVATSLWCCSKCTVINATALTECSICGNKAPRAAGSAPAAHSPPQTSSSRALALIPTPEPTPQLVEWSCAACTMLNAGDATKCTICDTARPKATAPKVGSAADGMLALYNAAEDVSKKSAAASGPWFCSACTMENKNADDTCYMCSTPRAVPIAAAVDDTPEVVMSLPSPTPDPPLLPVPIDLTFDHSASETRPLAPLVSLPSAVSSAAVENLKFLREYKQTVAEATCPRDVVDALRASSWETTAGVLTLSLQQSFVADLVEGTYADRDGYLSGIARVTADGAWKLEGKFRKLAQTQENALVLQWNPSATRFDGKWFRGDGSGDWKCVLSPSSDELRGLNVVEDAKDRTHLQPFYSGLINMKQNLTNVCYQNSFLQTLFMTQAFRRLILSADLAQYTHSSSKEAAAGGGSDVLGCVQDLFARMLASQRPSLDSHMLQRCLPPTFQAGRQQDTSDFAHYLIDSLSEQLNSHPGTVDGVSDIFGGIQATVLACKTCGKTSVMKEYFWELLLNMIDLRYTPITNITAVSGSSMNIATPSGYERLNTDVNKDRSGAPYVFLCVKRCPERKSSSAMDVDDAELMPITDLVIKVAPYNEPRPTMPGYERVELDLNFGGSVSVVGGKKQVFLFTRREPNGSPITDLQVIYGNEAVPDGFKQIRVDLNQGEGTKVFLCYRCDMPLTDLKIVNSGIPGYKMVDHLLNLSHEDAVKQYLAYQVGGNEPCLTDLQLVTGEEVAQYEAAGWTSIGSPTSVTFDPDAPLDDPPRVPAQLMIRRGHGNPIFAVDVFRAPRQVPKYNDYEVIDVYPHAASAADAPSALKGDWMAGEDVDRTRKAVRIHSVSEPIAQALVVKGSFEDKGEVTAIATAAASSWSQAVASAPGASDSSQAYRVTGHWKASKVKQAQLFDVELRPDAASGLYALSGMIGDGKGRAAAIHGRQTSRSVKVKWPISELLVLRGDEKVPDGVRIVSETVSGRSGNLLAQTTSPHSLYLAVKREATPASGHFVSDVCVIYGEIDAVPDAYTCIEKTPGGFSANLNDGTAGVPIFVCYRRATGAAHEKVLMDVAPMWTSGPQVDAVPAEFTKIQHTPLGMDANVNQGTTGGAIHLCFAKTDPAHVVTPVETPVNGEYEVTSAVPAGFGRFLSLSAAESVSDARVVEGKFGTILHGHLPGAFRATAFTSAHKPQGRRLLGVWSLDPPSHPTTLADFTPASYPCEWRLNEAGDELDGWWSGCEEQAAGVTVFSGTAATSSSSASGVGGSSTSSSGVVGGGDWKLLKDASVRIGFKKDYGTEWKDGQLIASERVWRHDLASMLARFDATRTLGGDNALACSQCARKTESRTHTVVVAPPAHLILTVKRMYYDWTQQKTRKSLHDVAFPALLALPPLSPEDEAVVLDDGGLVSDDRQRRRDYGLYGVLIHSGMTANSGHYYSFCRESDDAAQELHLEDSPSAPWIKFNDTKVERSHWAEINRLVANSVSDAVYLLLYKKLSYPVPEAAAAAAVVGEGGEDPFDAPRTSGDDEEAMLLAKAMALSMSAAGRKRQSADNSGEAEETKRDGEEGEDGDNDNDGAKGEEPHRRILPTILREVEKENTTFLLDTLSATSSSLHTDDLHTLLVLRRAVPLQVRAILEQCDA